VKELVRKNFKEIREIYKNENLNREGFLLVAQHEEARRWKKVKIVLNVRE